MGDYINFNQNDNNYWNYDSQVPVQTYYEQDYNQFANQQLEFNNSNNYSEQTYANFPPQMLMPDQYNENLKESEELEEPPLLDELEIYPDRILEKVLAVLNPLRGHSLADDAEYLTKESDLAGPILFCVLLAVSLFLAGKNSHFSSTYGISVILTVLMYFLLNLMTAANNSFTLSTTGSILGYCLLPITGLSLLAVFFKLSSQLGMVLSVLAVLWSSFSASRLFVAVFSDKEQQPLIAYACILVYGVFTLLAVF